MNAGRVALRRQIAKLSPVAKLTQITYGAQSTPAHRSNTQKLQSSQASSNHSKTYSTVQTGPNTQPGGFQPGFCSIRYQVPTLVAVKNPPTAHAANAAARNPLNDNQLRMNYHARTD